MKTEILEQVARLGLERTLLNLRLALTPVVESEDGDGAADGGDIGDEEEEEEMVSGGHNEAEDGDGGCQREAAEGGAEEAAAEMCDVMQTAGHKSLFRPDCKQFSLLQPGEAAECSVLTVT